MTEDEAPLTRAEFLSRLRRRAPAMAAAFATGWAIDEIWARIVRGPRLEREDYPRMILGGWRVHHSALGYLLVLVGLVWRPFLLVPAGLGLIVGHWRRDRLWFLERVR